MIDFKRVLTSITSRTFSITSISKISGLKPTPFKWWGEVLQLGSIININRNGKDAQCEKVIPAIAHLAFHHSEHLLQQVQLHRSASFHVHTVNLQHSWIQVSEKTTHEHHIIYCFFSLFYDSTFAFGFFSLRYFPTPVTVPPLPIPMTKTSTCPSVSSHISGPVVS